MGHKKRQSIARDIEYVITADSKSLRQSQALLHNAV